MTLHFPHFYKSDYITNQPLRLQHAHTKIIQSPSFGVARVKPIFQTNPTIALSYTLKLARVKQKLKVLTYCLYTSLRQTREHNEFCGQTDS